MLIAPSVSPKAKPTIDTLALDSLIAPLTPAQTANLAYLVGDHWQNELGWIGPTLPPDAKNRTQAVDGVRREFTPIPVTEDCIDRAAKGAVGKEPAFSFADKAAPRRNRAQRRSERKATGSKTLIDDLDELAGDWWDSHGCHGLLLSFVSRLLCAERAVLRMAVPAALLVPDPQGVIRWPALSFEETLRYISVQVLEPATAGVESDLVQPRAVFRYTPTLAEQTMLDAPVAQDTPKPNELAQGIHYELQSVPFAGNPARKTVIEVCSQSGEVKSQIALDLDRELLMHGAELQGFISDPARRLQRAIDTVNTMLPMNAMHAGFRTRHLFNAQEPTRLNAATGEREVVSPQLGPGKFSRWASAEYEDSDGNTKLAPASMLIEEPVDSQPQRDDLGHYIEKLLESFDQSHILQNADGQSSAVALVQKRAAFALSLRDVKAAVEAAVRWMVRTALLLAAALSQDMAHTALLKTLRLDATAKIDTGPLSPEERRVVIEEMNAGVMDRELAMSMLGVEDVDAALDRLEDDEEYQLGLATKRAAYFAELFRSGAFTREQVGRIVFGGEDVLQVLAGPEVPAEVVV